MKPKILQAELSHDFHDSILLKFNVSSDLLTISIVLATQDNSRITKYWEIRFEGVLRLEYETLGEGEPNKHGVPIQIYDVYRDDFSKQRKRWTKRLKKLGVNEHVVNNLYHVILASSFIRGWGENEDNEGISIICLDVLISEVNDM